MHKEDQRLKLIAFDAEDLSIISALLQDALIQQSNVAYLSKYNRFAAIADRYRWEQKGKSERIRCGVHFNGITNVQVRNFYRSSTNRFLELLAIECNLLEDGGAVIFFQFSGRTSIKLVAECIDCELHDLTDPWSVKEKPFHQLY